MSPYLGTGNVVYCTAKSCTTVASNLNYPNGLIVSHTDNHLYVPSSILGGINVFVIEANRSLTFAEHIPVPYAIDNLSQDADGTIWAAVMPVGLRALQTAYDPLHKTAPSAVIKIWKTKGSGFAWEKVLEDRDNDMLPCATTVVHDEKTGRLFVSGKQP